MEEEFSASDDDDDECVLNTNYNIAMLQVHRNPTILLDDCSLAAGGPSYSSVFRDREEREAGEVSSNWDRFEGFEVLAIGMGTWLASRLLR